MTARPIRPRSRCLARPSTATSALSKGWRRVIKENVKRVFYVRRVAHPCYLDIIAQRPEIRLDKIEHETAEEIARPIMAAAHAYQIGSSRDELPPRFHVERGLLARMPNLLVISTNGAGFDTVNAKHCTDAGVLVVNQSGGNA